MTDCDDDFHIRLVEALGNTINQLSKVEGGNDDVIFIRFRETGHALVDLLGQTLAMTVAANPSRSDELIEAAIERLRRVIQIARGQSVSRIADA